MIMRGLILIVHGWIESHSFYFLGLRPLLNCSMRGYQEEPSVVYMVANLTSNRQAIRLKRCLNRPW